MVFAMTRVARTAAALLTAVLVVGTTATHATAATDNRNVWSFGVAEYHGSTGTKKLNGPIVGIAATSTGNGYWMLAQDGGVFSYGDAKFHGSTGNMKLNQPIVSIASDPKGRGYWFVAADGGIFTFGPEFHGSTGDRTLPSPVVGMSPTPTGDGYYLMGRDGAVYAFGDAKHLGDGTGKSKFGFAGIAADPDGAGYWLATTAGEVLGFDAAIDKPWDTIERTLNQKTVGIAANKAGGYWLLGHDGQTWRSRPNMVSNNADQVWTMSNPYFAGIAAHPTGNGFWLAAGTGKTIPKLTPAQMAENAPKPVTGAVRVDHSNSGYQHDGSPLHTWASEVKGSPYSYADHYIAELKRLGWFLIRDHKVMSGDRVSQQVLEADRGHQHVRIVMGYTTWGDPKAPASGYPTIWISVTPTR